MSDWIEEVKAENIDLMDELEKMQSDRDQARRIAEILRDEILVQEKTPLYIVPNWDIVLPLLKGKNRDLLPWETSDGQD